MKKDNKLDNNIVDLFVWLSEHCTDEDKREVFLKMDIALKYIHNHGFCIGNFHPSRIKILYDNPNYVKFEDLVELSSDPSERSEMIKTDIFNSSLIQIGIYTNTLKSLTPSFLKENFDEIARFLPEGDVPYYRGVVQRGATVYFSEFVLEKMNRDYKQLEQQINESEGGKSLTNSNDDNKIIDNLSNDKINDSIYKMKSDAREAAFINNLLIPTVIILSIVFICLIAFILIYS